MSNEMKQAIHIALDRVENHGGSIYIHDTINGNQVKVSKDIRDNRTVISLGE
jgi:hypothetical protein